MNSIVSEQPQWRHLIKRTPVCAEMGPLHPIQTLRGPYVAAHRAHCCANDQPPLEGHRELNTTLVRNTTPLESSVH